VPLRTAVSLAVILLVAPLARAADIESDDPAARLRATREWYGSDVGGRAGILEAAQRERDRYAIGRSRIASGATRLSASSAGAFVNLGPTRANYAVNGDRYTEIDSGRVRQILAHPMDANILFVATAGGGVWKTYGATSRTVLWEPLTDAIGTTAVGALAMDPSNPDILFLGFGDPFDVQQPGITRSTDGGGTWSPPAILTATYTAENVTRALTAGAVTDIRIDPRNSAMVLATTDAGLFRSKDGGAVWEHVPLIVAGVSRFYYMWSLAWVGNDTWLATGQEMASITAPTTPAGGGSLALFRSTDDGVNWSLANSALPGGAATAELAGRATLASAQSTTIEPANARIYLLAGAVHGNAQLDLFRSDDGGLSFQALQVNAGRGPENQNPDLPTLDVLSGQAWYNQALVVDPANPDAVFIGGQLAIVRSLDAGRTWWVLSDWLPHNSENANIDRPYVHADLHSFAIGADGLFYAGSDGGISVSPNALSSPAKDVLFSSATNEGLVTHLAYTVACAPASWPGSARGFIAGGMQDNGTRVRFGETTTFNQVLGGDGIGLAVSAATKFDATLQVDVPEIFFASVAGGLYRSTDGGQSFDRFTSGLESLPFFVRIVRAAAAPEQYLTFSDTPAGVYRWQSGTPSWTSVSGVLHWQDSNRDTRGFTTVDGTQIGLRNLAAHPASARVWGAVSNRYTYVTSDGGAHWLVGVHPRPPQSAGGVYLLSSIAFDPSDPTGQRYYITSLATALIDPQTNTFSPYPPDFGHVLRTRDGGATWESLGARPVANGGLPAVGANVIKVDPADPAILYVGTVIGLYRSTDSGVTWSRFGAGSLPLVEVRDICFAPPTSPGERERLTVATYGRGFWQIDTDDIQGGSAAGVRGLGDTNFDSRIDGDDLIDLADGLGATQASPVYRWQADLIGTTNGIDEDDLNALLAKFGGWP
jgi:photosystem II stability/assembly factor-like uncharacterized protein